MIDSAFLVRTLSDLVRINSINPALEQHGPGESEIAAYIHQVLTGLEISAHIDDLGGGRCNVIARLPGAGGGKSIMLNGHMDTVGVAGMENPFSGEIKDGKLFGRGAYDMKASLAAMMTMAKAIKDEHLKMQGDVILSFVADEEYNSIGSEDVVKKYKTDGCIVTEPTELNICLGHRGFGIYELKTQGVIAHGGKHLEGVDANMKMGLLLHELNKISQDLIARKPHPLLGTGSMHVPLIKGGQSLFIYSGECTIQVERRTLPGETQEGILSELNTIIRKLSEQDPQFKATVTPVLWRNPCEVGQDSSLVTSMISAVTDARLTPHFIGHTWWEDSGLFSEAGTETVIMGPTGGGIHQAVEWVEVESVIKLAEVLLGTVVRYGG